MGLWFQLGVNAEFDKSRNLPRHQLEVAEFGLGALEFTALAVFRETEDKAKALNSNGQNARADEAVGGPSQNNRGSGA